MACRHRRAARNGVIRVCGVKTASQGQLVVMLYEEACRQLEKAANYLKPNNTIEPRFIESLGQSLQKAQDIITELQVSLDMEKGGEIAQNLMSLYVYFNRELMDANIHHNKQKILFIYDMMCQLRDSWIQAANSTANTTAPTSQDRPALNITG